ncbi:unnamed protein product [Penicillium olsonii]|uniref:Uncharacterized protein n=1 Tax=Penicillium olsonii TaxID=99116 RepID=A0A9W4I0H9_PENOL|nr:unnamed protein product [Penicillium olsonii]CAG8184936.1 unnamed protein product [Penicillium olsonii]
MMGTTTERRVSATAVGIDQSTSAKPFIPPSHPKSLALPPPPTIRKSKMVRLKLTKPRPAKRDPKEVDWDEDLRPTPIALDGDQADHDPTTHAHTDPKKAKNNGKAGRKRASPLRRQTTSVKRKKPNVSKSTSGKRANEIPQLPLITVAKGALASTIEQEKPSVPPHSNDQSNAATKNKVDLPEASHQTSPPADGPMPAMKYRQRVSVEIRSSSSAASVSSLNFDYDVKGPSQGPMVSILEHRAQLNELKNKEKAARMTSDTYSTSSGDIRKPHRVNSSRLTIRESRELSKQMIPEPTAKRKTRASKLSNPRGSRAQSVGNKLMLALHVDEEVSKPGPVIEDQGFIVISSDSVDSEKSPLTNRSDVPSNATSKVVDPEHEHHGAARVDEHKSQAKSSEVRSSSPAVDGTKEAEAIDTTSGMVPWGIFLSSLGHSDASSIESSPGVEIGRGLINDEPSILDHHMEMEHLSGFESLRPIISEPATSSQVTKRCESWVDTSSGSHPTEEDAHLPAIATKKCESNHTPESQKPLLRGETVVTSHSASPPEAKSAPRTSIVDTNGSPRLVPLSAKEMIPGVDYDGEKYHDVNLNTSPSQYDRSFSYHSGESDNGGHTWTKYQRDIFLAYGIRTEELVRSHAWSSARHRPSFSQEVADGAASDQASTISKTSPSSHRTIGQRGVDARQDRQFDRSIGTDISGSSQADVKSHRFSDEDPMEWISTLKVAQKDAHNLLHQTNTNLSIQLDAEKATITRVLEIYREGCGRILDDLFQAQEARMGLYRQQIRQVKEQHADICQDLVRGLQELDRRVQQGPI